MRELIMIEWKGNKINFWFYLLGLWYFDWLENAGVAQRERRFRDPGGVRKRVDRDWETKN